MLTRISNWAEQLTIPKRFSTATNKAIKTGMLSSKAQDEIIHSLSTLIMVHTVKPSPDDYNTVCLRLIKAYPLLADNVDGGYVSLTQNILW